MWRRACGWVGDAERRSRMRRTSRGPSRAPRRFTKAASAGPSMSSRPVVEPSPQGGDGGIVHRHPPLLPALPEDGDRPAAQVDVAAVEAAELRHPQPGRVEELEDGHVTPVHGGVSRHVEQRGHFAAGEHAGQTPSPGRRTQRAGRVGLEATLPDQPGEVAAQRSRLAGDGGPGQLPRPERGQVAPQVQAIDARRALDVAAGHPFGECGDVGHVGLAGRRRPASQPSRKPRQIPRSRHEATVPPPRRGSWALTSPENLRGVRWVR